nr:transposase [Floricoccus penangensis]
MYTLITVPCINGKIEDMNNNIKVIKRISYGYRNFNNLTKRMLIDQRNIIL